MQLVTGNRQVVTGGVQDSTSFGFDAQDLPFIKKILRDSIYSDKHLAPIREYSANAWDAHRMAGRPELPIKVRVPTQDDPRLLIEDYGPGLSHEEVFNTYAKYGRSTKRDTNNAVGMLGIGSKSAFCYSDTFVITSRYGGEKRVYVAKLNMDGNDSLDLLSTTPWTEDTGITISIAVKPQDIGSFERKARDLFKYFDPRPDINIDLPPVPKIRSKLKHGLIYEHNQYGNEDARSGKWLALMGCIPYSIDLNQLVDAGGKTTISNIFKTSAGILDFPVGAVQISSSRESLEYSDLTKAALTKKFADLLDEYTTFVLAEIEKGDLTNWEKRLRAQRLLHLGLTEKEIGDWAQHRIYLKPKTFRLNHPIDVLSDTRLIRRIIPEGKDLRGYHLYGGTKVLIEPQEVMVHNPATDSYVPVQPPRKYTWEEIDAELETLLRENKLDGIPFLDLAEMEWDPPYTPKPRAKASRVSGPKDVKHTKRLFRLVGTDTYKGKKYSENWEVLDRAPKPDDVYVIISEFIPEEVGVNFYKLRAKDETMAKTFGVNLPDVYGYKSTESRPVDRSKIVGVPYSKWRAEWYRSLVQREDIKYAREFFAWREAYCPYWSNADEIIAELARDLGEDHLILEYVRTASWAQNTYPDDADEWKSRVYALGAEGILGSGDACAAEVMKQEIFDRYPLLKGNSLRVLWYTEAEHWRRYIRCLDMEEKYGQYAVQPQLEFNI